MSKYVRCTCCGKRIELDCDTPAYTNIHDEGTIFCDGYCFAEYYGWGVNATEKFAREVGLEVFDDEERKKELRKEVSEMERKLLLAKLELEGLEHPFNA